MQTLKADLEKDQVEIAAMKLSPEARADLADKLWLSVHSTEEVDAAWEAEVARRLSQISAGEVQCVPWSDVMGDLRAKLA